MQLQHPQLPLVSADDASSMSLPYLSRFLGYHIQAQTLATLEGLTSGLLTLSGAEPKAVAQQVAQLQGVLASSYGIPLDGHAEAIRDLGVAFSFHRPLVFEDVERLIAHVRPFLPGESGVDPLLAQGLERHAPALSAIFRRAEQALRGSPGEVFVEEAGAVRVEARLPSARGGKHAFVGLVTLTLDGRSWDAVIRGDLVTPADYLEIIRAKPEVAGVMPSLYGRIGPYAVMERLKGLELDEVSRRLETDPSFARRYAQAALSLIQGATEKGMMIIDVDFDYGHNCMYDGASGALRLVEQCNLRVSPLNYDSRELLMVSLLDQLRYRNAAKFDAPELNFLWELIRLAVSDAGLARAVVRERRLRFDHPEFRQVFGEQYFGHGSAFRRAKSEGREAFQTEFDRHFSDPAVRESAWVIYGSFHWPLVFSEDFLRAVRDDDRARFDEIVHGRKFVNEIRDKSDPRYTPVYL